MKQALIVGLGGFIGAIIRYKLAGIILHHTLHWRFPLGTFIVNVLGCFAIGLLAGLAERRDFLSPDLRLFLFTGMIGGFTTFSAFAFEGILLCRRGEWLIALLYTLLSVICGFIAVWVGVRLLNPNA